jgi:serine protein kinase
MANSGARDFKSLIGKLQEEENLSALSWTGSFWDYLEIVKENPQVTRNAYQRIYDMIMEAGTEEYTDVKKKITHYKFFDDADNNGADAVLVWMFLS